MSHTKVPCISKVIYASQLTQFNGGCVIISTADEGVGFLASGQHEGKDQARGLCSVISRESIFPSNICVYLLFSHNYIINLSRLKFVQ